MWREIVRALKTINITFDILLKDTAFFTLRKNSECFFWMIIGINKKSKLYILVYNFHKMESGKSKHHGVSPIRLSSLENIWHIGNPMFLNDIRASEIVPDWQIEWIEKIKEIGKRTLGRSIRDFAEYNTPFNLENICLENLPLYEAMRLGTITPYQLFDGAKNIHYSGDIPAYIDALVLLPQTISTSGGTQKTRISDQNRILIKQINSKPLDERPDDLKLSLTSRSLAQKCARYLGFGEPKPVDIESFKLLASQTKRVIIPLRRRAAAFDFWVHEPEIHISEDDYKKVLAGKLSIEAVSFFDAGDEKYPPRIILKYAINRQWNLQSLRFIQKQFIEPLARSIEIANDVERRNLKKRPLEGGGFQGK